MTRNTRELEEYIRDSMARALWVHAYMIWATEVEPTPVIVPGTWDGNAIDTRESRRVSLLAANALTEMFQTANRLGPNPMAQLFIATDTGPHEDCDCRATRADRAVGFGRDIAGVCLGTREVEDISLPAGTVVPSFSVSLDDDGQQLTWEGRTDAEPGSLERNPAGDEVLLIEDEPLLQRATTRMIKKIFPGAEVVVADNGDAAIANLRHHKFVHIVSDVDILGSKSGIDVFLWVKENQPHMVSRYTFFTGNVDAERVHDRVIMKPAGVAELKEAIMRRSSPPTAPPPSRTVTRPPAPASTAVPAPLSSKRVAEAVYRVMPLIREEPGERGRPRGRYGTSKVFIAAIWRQLQGSPPFAGLTLDDFKRLLVGANRDRELVLARADVVGAMDRTEVAESEIVDRGASYNFVLDPTAKDPWG